MVCMVCSCAWLKQKLFFQLQSQLYASFFVFKAFVHLMQLLLYLYIRCMIYNVCPGFMQNIIALVILPNPSMRYGRTLFDQIFDNSNSIGDIKPSLMFRSFPLVDPVSGIHSRTTSCPNKGGVAPWPGCFQVRS